MPRPAKEFVKIETRLLNDYKFLMLSEFDQLFYIKLLLLARITDNKIPNCNAKIDLVLKTNREEKDIEKSIEKIKDAFPKLKSNKHFHYFIGYNARMNKYLPKKEDNEEPDEEEDIDIDKEEDKEKPSTTNESFLKSLKDNPAYKHINIDHELGKMDAWLSTRPGRQKTRRFMVNWLNKIEKPFVVPKKKEGPYKPPERPDPAEREKVAELMRKTAKGLEIK